MARTRTKRAPAHAGQAARSQTRLRRAPRARRGRSRARATPPTGAATQPAGCKTPGRRRAARACSTTCSSSPSSTWRSPSPCRNCSPRPPAPVRRRQADDPDAGDEVIPRILDQLDTPAERARLARTIIHLATPNDSTRYSRPPRSSTSTAARGSCSARASSAPRSSTPAACEPPAACASPPEITMSQPSARDA